MARAAVWQAFSLPALLLCASMVGFGSLVRDSGLSLAYAMSATAAIWGLPAQVALVELYGLGLNVLAVLFAAAMANVRFLPMAISFMPLMQGGQGAPRGRLAAAHLVSVSTWAVSLKAFPPLSPAQRYAFFLGFGGACFLAGLAGTALGYLTTGALPRPLALSLIFLNPLFFALLFAGSRERPVVLALLAGAVSGPPLHLLTPDWGLLLTGLLAGTLAFALDAWLRGRRG